MWPFEGGEAAQGTSGVVDAVTNGTGTIGYADASRAGDLGTVASARSATSSSSYIAEAAAAVVDASPLVEGRADGDLAIEIDRTTDEAGAYPIVLVSYIIGCQRVRGRRERRAREGVRLRTSPAPRARTSRPRPPAPRRSRTTLREQVAAAIDSIK